MTDKSVTKTFYMCWGITLTILSALICLGCVGGIIATTNYDSGCGAFYYYPSYYYYDYDCTHNKYGLSYSQVKIFNFTEEGYPLVRLTFSQGYVTVYPCNTTLCPNWYYPTYDPSTLRINDTTIASYPNLEDTGVAYGNVIFTDKYAKFLYYHPNKKIAIYFSLSVGIVISIVAGMICFACVIMNVRD